MKLFLFYCVLLLDIGNSWAMAQTDSGERQSDNQSWNDVQISVPLNKRVDLIVGGTLRFGDNVKFLVTKMGSVGLAFKVNK